MSNTMSPYDPNIHHRRSIRLRGYDYASEGMYFVTICTQNRECLFGKIENNAMVLNDAGRMVERWYHKTQEKFPDIVCHEMVVMPNHFHCIWENVGLVCASAVGANPRVRPSDKNNVILIEGEHTGAQIIECHENMGEHTGAQIIEYHENVGEHTGSPLRDTDLGMHVGSPLSAVVGWFKTMSTNEYIRGVKQLGWPPFDRKLWQRNYYERIIRDDASLRNVAFYIDNNPAHWRNDDFYHRH